MKDRTCAQCDGPMQFTFKDATGTRYYQCTNCDNASWVSPESASFSKTMLFATLGCPGSGKTFFSQRFAADMKMLHLNSDSIRHALFPQPTYAPEEHAVVFRLMDCVAQGALQNGVSVIYDANSIYRSNRERLQNIATQAKATYTLLWINTPLDVALARVRTRAVQDTNDATPLSIPVSEDIVRSIAQREEAPLGEAYISFDGQISYEMQKVIVLRSLSLHQT